MTTTEQLKDLVANERVDETLVFLKALSAGDKKELEPVLKELNAYYSQWVDLTTMEKPVGDWQTGRSYGARARGEQGRILALASFVCLDKKGFENSLMPSQILRKEMLDQLLPWYTPTWFTSLLKDINTARSFLLDYELIMELQAAGYFTPSPELIVHHLPTLMYGTGNYDRRNPKADVAHLLKYPDTLDKHVWYFFEYPSNIHNFSRYQKTDKSWKDFILQFTTEGRLDRMRVLQECLRATNRNFNKVLAGWFVELFTFLKPTTSELEALQPLLMTVLDSKHTTAVNLGLNSLKQVKSLDHHTFITHLPQVILAGTKAILTTVLQLAEAICKQHAEERQQVCIQLCQVFLNKDEGIQQKTAKLISTYGLPASDELEQQLQMYADTMLTGVRQQLLAETATVALAEDAPLEILPLIGAHNLIPAIDTVEDLVYFASQVFENNAPYHAELLPAVLINLQHLITDEVRVQLQPALKRAQKLQDRPTNNMGQIDHLLTYFLPAYFNGQVSWKVKENHLRPYTRLWQYALDKLQAKDSTPLLSTPTHTPAWIDPVVLVNRLAQYTDQAPDELDLQIAICRCTLEDTSAAITLAKQSLSGKHKELMLFLLDQSATASGTGNAWIQAANRKGLPFTPDQLPVEYINGQFEWNTVVEHYMAYGTYNRETRDYDRVPATRVSIQIKFPEEVPLNDAAPLLQHYLVHRENFFELSSGDIPKVLSLTPANPSLLLANIIDKMMPLSGMYEVTEITGITAAITWLKEKTIPYMPIEQLFIATCMLHADKTIRALAAECWITRVSYNRLDSENIGRIIGTHQRLEWAPLKRLTDLVTEQLMQISKTHNEALETLLSTCIGLLPDSPVKNLKKLLEVYAEVLSVNGHVVTDTKVQERLEVWKKLAGYKKLPL